MLPGSRGIAGKEETYDPRCEDRVGTRRVHADLHDGTITVHGYEESSVITGDRWPLDADDIPTPLDRTQEVAGSSPASSMT
jgi:hypothetical protein